MAFPSLSGSTQKNLAEAWSVARSLAGSVKANAQSLKSQSESGVNAERILAFATELAEAKISLNEVAALQGIAAYAQEQTAYPGLDVAAAFTAMVQQIDATIAWIVANIPKDGSGYLLVQSILSNGRTTSRTFDQASTADLRTQLDALIATID